MWDRTGKDLYYPPTYASVTQNSPSPWGFPIKILQLDSPIIQKRYRSQQQILWTPMSAENSHGLCNVSLFTENMQLLNKVFFSRIKQYGHHMNSIFSFQFSWCSLMNHWRYTGSILYEDLSWQLKDSCPLRCVKGRDLWDELEQNGSTTH